MYSSLQSTLQLGGDISEPRDVACDLLQTKDPGERAY